MKTRRWLSTVMIMNGLSFGSVVTLPNLANVDYQLAGAADFDADGDPDLVLSNCATGRTALWVMNGLAFESVVNLPAVTNLSLEIAGRR